MVDAGRSHQGGGGAFKECGKQLVYLKVAWETELPEFKR